MDVHIPLWLMFAIMYFAGIISAVISFFVIAWRRSIAKRKLKERFKESITRVKNTKTQSK